MVKLHITIPKDLKQWLDDNFGNVSQKVRELVAREKHRVEDEAEQEKLTDNRPAKARLFDAVNRYYHIREALRVANIRNADFERWCEDEEFLEELDLRQQDYLNRAEMLIMDCAMNLRYIEKQAMTGLIAFLNNNHPNWGRVKIEMMSRAFNPIFDGLLKIVQAKLDESTYKEIADEFQRFKEINLSAFSD